MRKVNVAEDIVPIGHFKSHSTELLQQMRSTGRPLVLTRNGRPAAVMMSPEEFEQIGYRVFVQAKIAAGTASAEKDGTVSSTEARKRLRARLSRPRED
jgi:prevent-host-death family protein